MVERRKLAQRYPMIGYLSQVPPRRSIGSEDLTLELLMNTMMRTAMVILLGVGAADSVLADKPADLAQIKGKIQFVDSFPDYKVKVVSSFADLHVQMVESFPDRPGKWQTVTSFPDYKIQLVDSFPDFTIKFVESFPGVQ